MKDKMGPLNYDMPKPCPACDKPIVTGEFCTLIPLGPGDDEEDQKKCREGKFYSAISLPVHWACATGEIAN